MTPYKHAYLRRANPTPAENVLWQRVRGRRLDGYRFRRQHVIQRTVVDFYCHEAKLIIEIDEPDRVEDMAMWQRKAERRDGRLRSMGYAVLRFTEGRVMTETRLVLEEIAFHLNRLSADAAHPGSPTSR